MAGNGPVPGDLGHSPGFRLHGPKSSRRRGPDRSRRPPREGTGSRSAPKHEPGDHRHARARRSSRPRRSRRSRPAIDQLPTELGVPGRIEVNADRRIEIRPRAAGVVREVHVVLGQNVKRGDPLVTLDSPDVGTARLNLRARQRELNTARIEAEWKSQVAATVALLIPEIRKGTDPAAIEKEFADKPLGSYRGSLLSSLRRVRHRGPRGGEDRRPAEPGGHRRASRRGGPAHSRGTPGQALRHDRAGQVRRRPGEAAGRPAAAPGRIRRHRRGPATAHPGRLGEHPRPARPCRQGRRDRRR